jgi:hypothetical protein
MSSVTVFFSKGDSWYRFEHNFEKIVKKLGLSNVFGFDNSLSATGTNAPERTRAAMLYAAYQLDMKYNQNILDNQLRDANGDLLELRTLVHLTNEEQKEYEMWSKQNDLFRSACARGFSLLQDSLDPLIWSNITAVFGRKMDMEVKDSIVTLWRYLKDKYGVPSIAEIEHNNELINSIPKFDRWQEAEIHIARYLELMSERESWDIEERHTDRMKANWLVTRLVDPEFKSVRSLCEYDLYNRKAVFTECFNRVDMCIQILHANRKGAMTVNHAMVPDYNSNEANVVQRYTKNINQKPSVLIGFNSGGRNHRAQDCPSLADSRPTSRTSEDSSVITPKQVSYDTPHISTSHAQQNELYGMSTPMNSGVKRKSEDSYRRPSSLTSTQYDTLKKQKQIAHAAYAAIKASLDEILNSYESNGDEEMVPNESATNDSASAEEVDNNHLDLSFE